MSRLSKLLFAALFLFFTSSPLLAAEAEVENQAEETDEVVQIEGDDVALDDSASDDDEVPEEESPSRFIPTEQISQDLGVSFPADI